MELAMDDDLDRERKRPARVRRLLPYLALPMLAIALVIAWRVSASHEQSLIESLESAGHSLADDPLGVFVVVGVFCVAVLLAFPSSALIIATVLSFGPVRGAIYSWLGLTCAALSTFALGAAFGRKPAVKFARARPHSRVRAWRRKLRSHAFVVVLLLRLLPVAPTVVVNVLCGAARVRFRDYAWGSALGFVPGVLYYSAFGQSLSRWRENPSVEAVLVIALVVAIGAGIAFWTRRRVARHEARVAGPAVRRDH